MQVKGRCVLFSFAWKEVSLQVVISKGEHIFKPFA